MKTPKKNKLVQPVVKWAGGKRQLLQEINEYIPQRISTYYEPFLGGGALLYHLQPRRAIVSDTNKELINVYNVIRDNVEELIHDLAQHINSEEHYYYVREMDRTPQYERMSNIQKASRIIFLNKTCYNGLFRVNSQGQFNVPYGKYKKPNIVNEIVLRAVSGFLNSNDIRFLNVDYEESLYGIRRGAFVYFDPPYDPVSDTSSFTGYTLDGFGRDEQLRLKQICDRLNQRGIKFLLSNSATPFIKDIYSDYTVETVGANRSINSNADNRGEINEVLVRNYDAD